MHQPHSREFGHQTIFQLLDKRAAERPKDEAVILYDEQSKRHCLTFGKLHFLSQTLAAAMATKDLGYGDKVAIFMPTCLEFIVCFMALNRLGTNVIVIPFSESVGVLSDVLSDSKCSGLFCHLDQDQRKKKDLIDALHKKKISAGAQFVLKYLVTVGNLIQCDVSGNSYQYEVLLASEKTTGLKLLQQIETKVQLDNPAMNLLTSGSSGKPKLCQFTNQSLVVAIETTSDRLNINSKSRLFRTWPFSWAPGIGALLTIAVNGATCVFLSPVLLLKENRIEFFFKVLSEEKCNFASVPPALIYDTINNPSVLSSFDLSCLQSFESGGQLLLHTQIAKFIDLFPNVDFILVYGATETFGLVSSATYKKENISNTEQYGVMEVGPHFEVKVVDPRGNIVPVNNFGEIYIRSPTIFLEYLGNPQATLDSKTRTGWWRSQDIGTMDNKGKIKILGRMGNAINRATELLYPAEFEVKISKNHLVAKVAVVAVPDQRLYEEVCACVVLKDQGDHDSQRAELEEWYEEVWPESADGASLRPGYTIFFKEFPLTRTMKPDRRKLRKMALENLGLQEVK